jgi:hypothetical protein
LTNVALGLRQAVGALTADGSSVASNVDTDSETLAPVVGDFWSGGAGCFILVRDEFDKLVQKDVTMMMDVPREDGGYYGFEISFDLTNLSSFDLKVSDIFFKTVAWRPLEKFEKYDAPLGLGTEKQYRCLVDKSIKEYRCHFIRPSPANFVLLHPRELDSFRIGISARTEGVYSGELLIDYSVAGRVGRIVAGKVSDMRFVDRRNPFLLAGLIR